MASIIVFLYTCLTLQDIQYMADLRIQFRTETLSYVALGGGYGYLCEPHSEYAMQDEKYIPYA